MLLTILQCSAKDIANQLAMPNDPAPRLQPMLCKACIENVKVSIALGNLPALQMHISLPHTPLEYFTNAWTMMAWGNAVATHNVRVDGKN